MTKDTFTNLCKQGATYKREDAIKGYLHIVSYMLLEYDLIEVDKGHAKALLRWLSTQTESDTEYILRSLELDHNLEATHKALTNFYSDIYYSIYKY